VTESQFSAGASEVGSLITITDVTDQEQYRRELERQNERLESFASMLSHDLRNPLSVAAGHLEMAREAQADRPATTSTQSGTAAGDVTTVAEPDHLEIVAESHDRMEALIEDVLTLARQGQPIDETELVDLEDLVGQCWNMVSTGEATLEVETEDRFVEADPERLQQLLENLFRNAIEHGTNGRREALTISVGILEDESGFYVEDDGVGIPEGDRQSVLESGYTTAEGGTGFGLAIVADIASAHDWTVEVTESAEGGARFEFRGVTLDARP